VGETPTAGEPRGRRGGCLLFLATVALWWFLLHDFVTTPITVLLSAVGATLVYGGLYLSLAGARYVFESVWYAGAWVFGLLMLAGAAATLAPAAPGELLMASASGWNVLAYRAGHLERAIEDGDLELAAKIARRGLGDPAPRDGFGIPLLHLAKDPEVLGTLLDAGLDPDAQDAEGRTLLMKTADTEIRQRLLDAGANREAGRDPGGLGAARARQDWLVTSDTTSGAGIPSGVSVEPDPLRPGEVGTVTIVVDNPSPEDRLLDLRAVLNNAIFLVGASHEGAVVDVGIPGPTATVRWPLLALPAGSRGQLEMRVLARPDDAIPDLPTGDMSIDVRVIDLPQRTEEILHLYQERAGAPARVDSSDPAFFFPIIPPLVLMVVFWLVMRRGRFSYSSDRDFRVGRIVAAVTAMICAATAASLAWSMIEPYVLFDETTCRVLDRRVLATEVESSSEGRTRTRQVVMQPHPVAAVEIDIGGEMRIAAGMSTSMATQSVQELQLLPIGSETRCWLDPRDPSRFTLLRGVPLAGGVGMAMLLVVTVVLSLITILLGRGLERPSS
jgi:hypothetical protein